MRVCVCLVSKVLVFIHIIEIKELKKNAINNKKK